MISRFFYFFFKKVKCYFEQGFIDTPVYLIEELFANDHISGPAIIIDPSW